MALIVTLDKFNSQDCSVASLVSLPALFNAMQEYFPKSFAVKFVNLSSAKVLLLSLVRFVLFKTVKTPSTLYLVNFQVIFGTGDPYAEQLNLVLVSGFRSCKTL